MIRWWAFALLLVADPGIAGPGCPASFDAFLEEFETDRQFQEAHTAFPLKHSYVDLSADPAPKTVDAPLSKQEVVARKNAIYPSPAEQMAVPFLKSVRSAGEEKQIVRLQKPDTGYLLVYHFQKDDCWRLIEFEDAST